MRYLLLLLLLFFFFFLALLSNPIGSTADEGSTLLSIKAGLVDPLNELENWDSAAAGKCNWTGVQCNDDGAVERLDLSSRNLTGVLSFEAFQALPGLVHLNLCCNSFAGSLPRSIPALFNLRVLDISDNAFDGHFPAGIGTFPRLETLNASGNNFAGTLPADIGNASILENLDLRGGYFVGSIPRAYRTLQNLRFLGLSGNNLTGELPPELGQLAALETLIIGYNSFEGHIPAEFGNLTNLRYLDLAVGSLTGHIPAELGKLPFLSTVYLYRNKLDGKIPKVIGSMSSLVYLDLSDNMISGGIPPEFAQLVNLQLLNLMCNKLEGLLPWSLGELPQLKVLELWNNFFTGPLPPTLGRNSSLQWLDVSSNSLTGEIPPGLCDGGELTKLILFNNKFSGQIPAGISACKSLIRVRMENNRLNGTVPGELGQLPSLQRLELADNNLSGSIPEEFSSSTSLSFIDFSRNRLQLSLPNDILSIPTLQTFLATGNELTGEIPSDVDNGCSALSTLDLSGNHLTGTIPSSLSSCPRLVNLNLRDNDLTGEIPPAIASMPTLAILDLSNNSLSGSIPESFGSSPTLEMLNISYNNLSGQVPANGVLRTINPSDLSGNPGLCGGVLPPCSGNKAFTFMRNSRIKHVVTGWLVGFTVAFAMVAGFLLARRLYASWNIIAGCCFDEGSRDGGGAWPWRLTAFQRLSFTSVEVLASIKESNVVGMGATGIVYKAEMPRHRTVVAVKKLWRRDYGDDEVGELISEVNLLGRLRHRNIVRTLGYINNDTDTMILYEYMPNGSLWEALHGGGGEPRTVASVLVDWVSRYNIALGVAQGLAYLHNDCHPPVIHRDVKSSNILLDANLEARIADFGLARVMLRKNETVSNVAGSYGYIAPEYGYTMKVDEKTDTYSYGVVAMELVTGKKPVEADFGEGEDIVGWVRDRIRSDRAEEVLDRSVGGLCRSVREEMLMVLRVAVLCTARAPKDRPSMRDVVLMLSEAKPRRKSSSAGGPAKDVRPVFTPESEYP